MSYRIALTLLFVFFAFVLIGCSEDSPPPQNVTITLGEIVSEPKQVELERYTQNNCGGSSETDYEVGRSRVIVRELEVGAGFEVNTKGEVSVLGTGVALGAAVSGQVGSTYGTQDSLERAVTVRAAPGTKMEHEISHQEIWKVGTATVVVNGQRMDIPFSYRHEFTLVLLDSRQLPCDSTATPIPTPIATHHCLRDLQFQQERPYLCPVRPKSICPPSWPTSRRGKEASRRRRRGGGHCIPMEIVVYTIHQTLLAILVVLELHGIWWTPTEPSLCFNSRSYCHLLQEVGMPRCALTRASPFLQHKWQQFRQTGCKKSMVDYGLCGLLQKRRAVAVILKTRSAFRLRPRLFFPLRT